MNRHIADWILRAVVATALLTALGAAPSKDAAPSPDEKLNSAANAGDVVAVTEALATGANINNTQGFINKTTPLMLAIMGGEKNRDATKLLLDRGADLSVTDQEGMTALLWAMYCGNVEAVQMLVDKGADVNAKNKHGMSPLFGAFASFGGDTAAKLAEPVIRAGADVNLKYKGVTPLIVALGKGLYPTARLLVEKGADVNAKNDGGVPALIFALYGGDATMPSSGQPDKVDVELIKLMVAKGADVNAATGNGITPLFPAAKVDLELVKLLIEKGADVNATTKDGMTVLKFVGPNGNPEIIKALRDAGARETERVAAKQPERVAAKPVVESPAPTTGSEGSASAGSVARPAPTPRSESPSSAGTLVGSVSVPAGLTIDDVENVVVRALLARRWTIQNKTEHRIVAHYERGQNIATLTIEYRDDGIRIFGVGSARGGGFPMRWVENLKKDMGVFLGQALATK